jgi:hypothetical protein
LGRFVASLELSSILHSVVQKPLMPLETTRPVVLIIEFSVYLGCTYLSLMLVSPLSDTHDLCYVFSVMCNPHVLWPLIFPSFASPLILLLPYTCRIQMVDMVADLDRQVNVPFYGKIMCHLMSLL